MAKNHKLILKNVSKTFVGNKKRVHALNKLNMEVYDKEFVAIVGPSGCGKTTLINLIAGLFNPSSGEIYFNGHKVVSPGKERGVVFQKYTTFPWLTVLENVQFGMNMLHFPEDKKQEIAKTYVKSLGLSGFEDEYPKSLSGGMQQRVAMARTLATDPELILLDEPFGALDTQTRRFMQDLLLQVWAKTKKTIFFVTHDVDEAIFMADRVFVMSARPGRIRRNKKSSVEKTKNIKN